MIKNLWTFLWRKSVKIKLDFSICWVCLCPGSIPVTSSSPIYLTESQPSIHPTIWPTISQISPYETCQWNILPGCLRAKQLFISTKDLIVLCYELFWPERRCLCMNFVLYSCILSYQILVSVSYWAWCQCLPVIYSDFKDRA